jgi:uncharacterized repeat protein (TIGR01451 family)
MLSGVWKLGVAVGVIGAGLLVVMQVQKPAADNASAEVTDVFTEAESAETRESEFGLEPTPIDPEEFARLSQSGAVQPLAASQDFPSAADPGQQDFGEEPAPIGRADLKPIPESSEMVDGPGLDFRDDPAVAEAPTPRTAEELLQSVKNLATGTDAADKTSDAKPGRDILLTAAEDATDFGDDPFSALPGAPPAKPTPVPEVSDDPFATSSPPQLDLDSPAELPALPKPAKSNASAQPDAGDPFADPPPRMNDEPKGTQPTPALAGDDPFAVGGDDPFGAAPPSLPAASKGPSSDVAAEMPHESIDRPRGDILRPQLPTLVIDEPDSTPAPKMLAEPADDLGNPDFANVPLDPEFAPAERKPTVRLPGLPALPDFREFGETPSPRLPAGEPIDLPQGPTRRLPGVDGLRITDEQLAADHGIAVEQIDQVPALVVETPAQPMLDRLPADAPAATPTSRSLTGRGSQPNFGMDGSRSEPTELTVPSRDRNRVRPAIVDIPQRELPAREDKPIRQVQSDDPFGGPVALPTLPSETAEDPFAINPPQRGREVTPEPRRLDPLPVAEPSRDRDSVDNVDFRGDGTIPARRLPGSLEPRLVIEKVAPPQAQLGQPLVYTVVVRNAGGSVAQQVVVEDRIPKGTRLTGTAPRAELIETTLRWKLGDLAPGEERKISIRVIPETEGSIGSVATVNFVAEVAAEILVTSPQLQLEVEAPEEARINEPLNLLFKISNVGNGDASQVVIRDLLPEGLQHPAGKDIEYPVGLLQSGETRELVLKVVPMKTGRITNVATLTAAGGQNRQVETALNVVGEALLLTRTAHEKIYVGQPAKIQNTVGNESSLPIERVQISEVIPPGFEVTDPGANGTYDARTRTLVWTLGPVAAGGEQTVGATLLAKATGSHQGTVTAMGVSGAVATLNTRVDVVGVPALSVDAPTDRGIVSVGDKVTVKLQVKNRGTAAARGLSFFVDMPEGVELVDASGPTEGQLEGNRLSFDTLETLPPQAVATFEVVLTPQVVGEARLDVQFTAEHLSRAVHREEILQVVEQTQ